MAKKKTGLLNRAKRGIKSVARKLGFGMKTTTDTFRLFDYLSEIETSKSIIKLPDKANLTPAQFESALVDLLKTATISQRTKRKKDFKFEWDKRSVNEFERRITERLFIRGLNSKDQQMRAPKRNRNSFGQARPFEYRADSGALQRSLKITPSGRQGDLVLTFRRDKVVIESLIERYGEMFDFSPSDIQYGVYLYLKQEKLLPRGTKAPAITSTGSAPYNEPKRRRSR